MTEFGTPILSSNPVVSGPMVIRPSGYRLPVGAGSAPATNREAESAETPEAVQGPEPAAPAADPPEIELSMASFRLHFRHDRESGRVAVTVIDAETREIIREIPPEELLQISKQLHETLGILFDREI